VRPNGLRAWTARNAMGLWFLGIALLAFVRWWMKVAREPAAADAPITVAWLAGSVVMAILGTAVMWRGRARDGRRGRQ